MINNGTRDQVKQLVKVRATRRSVESEDETVPQMADVLLSVRKFCLRILTWRVGSRARAPAAAGSATAADLLLSSGGRSTVLSAHPLSISDGCSSISAGDVSSKLNNSANSVSNFDSIYTIR